MKKISVIVPFYNSENYISKCLDSLTAQSYSNYEIILVNDGSTDNSLKICEEYANKNKNIVIINKKNGGQGEARNFGIKKASGYYITFVDSDDRVSLDMLEKLYNVSDNGKIDVVVCDILKIEKEKESYFNNFCNFNTLDSKNYMISHPGPVAKLYKKEILLRNNLFFLEGYYYEDLALMPLIGIYAKSFYHLKEALYYYCIRDNSTMKQKQFSTKLNDVFYVVDYLEKEFISRDISNYFTEELEYLFIEHLLYSASLRFLSYNNIAKQQLNKINDIIKDKYPRWHKNYYFKNRNIKFKFITWLLYKRKYLIVNFLKRIGDKK